MNERAPLTKCYRPVSVLVMSMIFNKGGWVLWLDPDLTGDLHVRFAPAQDGRLEICGWHMTTEGSSNIRARRRAIDGTSTREIPFGRILAMANAPEVRDRLLELIDAQSDDVEAAEDAFLKAVAPTRVGKPAKLSGSLRLPTSPEGRRRKPDSFFEAVARAYTVAATRSEKPAVLLAEHNDLDVELVHQWVREARRRRLLDPGRRGGGRD